MEEEKLIYTVFALFDDRRLRPLVASGPSSLQVAKSARKFLRQELHTPGLPKANLYQTLVKKLGDRCSRVRY